MSTTDGGANVTTINLNGELIGMGTVPCDQAGNPGVLNATHVLLAIGNDVSVILPPEKVWWLSQALKGQLPAVGYKVTAVPA